MKKILYVITCAILLANCSKNKEKEAENIINSQPKIDENETKQKPIIDSKDLEYGHVFTQDCSATSLDWQGDYLGATNGKDNYLRLRLTLNKNWTYILKIISLDDLPNGIVKENLQKEYKGSFTFNNSGEIIKLLGTKHPLTEELISVKLHENSLSVLDSNYTLLEKDGDMNTLYKQ